MGLFGGIAGAFSAVQQARAAGEATRVITETRQMLEGKAGDFSQEFQPFLAKSLATFDQATSQSVEDRALLRQLMEEARTADLGQGFSPADEIALKDAQRLMNENMVSTGNLRSGAAGYYGMELSRRITADVRSRAIDRRMAQLQLMFGGQGQGAQQTAMIGNIAGAVGQVGAYGKNLAAQLYQASGNLALGQASTILAKGAALGGAIDSAASSLDFLDPIEWARAAGGGGKGKTSYLANLFGTPGSAPSQAVQEQPGYGSQYDR